MDNLKIYKVMYCSCIYESGYTTVSLHRTKLGAYKSMRKEILDEWDSYLEVIHNFKDQFKYKLDHPLEYQRWAIEEVIVED